MDEDDIFNKNLKLIARSSFVVFIGIIISKILLYAYKAIIARYFGAEIYGIFSLAIMILTLFTTFFSFGLSDGLLRYISFYRGKKQNNEVKHILKFSLIFLLISGVIASLILFWSANFISINIFKNAGLIIFLKIFAFFIPVVMLSDALLSTLRAFEKINLHSFLTNIFGNLVKLSLLIFLIFLAFNNSIEISYVMGLLALLVASYFFIRYKIPIAFGKARKVKKEVTSEFFSYSWPFMFAGVLASIFYWTDSFMIGYFKTLADVGFYNAAVPLSLLFLIFPTIFMALFFPLINKEFSRKNFTIIKELSKQVGKWIFIFNFPFLILALLFPGAVINILFGSQYLVADNALRMLSIGLFISGMFSVSGHLLSMLNKSKLIMINIILTGIFNFLLNLILIPRYGINGAAFSTMLSFIVLNLIMSIEVKQSIDIIPLRRKLIKIILVMIAPIALLIFIKQFIPLNLLNIIIQVVLFLALYIFLIIITGCLDRNDLMIITALRKKIL